jgi:hypothetical protein
MDIFLLCDCFWLDHMSAGHCPVLRIWVVAMASGRGHIAFFEYASVSPLSFSFYFILPSPNSGRFNLFSSGVLLTFDRNLRSHTPSCASAEWRLGRWLIHCLWKTPAGPNSSDPPHTSLWFFVTTTADPLLLLRKYSFFSSFCSISGTLVESF